MISSFISPNGLVPSAILPVAAQAIDFRNAWLKQEDPLTILTPEGGVGFGWETQDLHSLGALGDASTATVATGKTILEHQAKLLEEVRRMDVAAWMQPGPPSQPGLSAGP